MASAIADFQPSAPGIAGYGYQPVTATYAPNPEFPAWLCRAQLPPGSVSNYCAPDAGPLLLAVGCNCQSSQSSWLPGLGLLVGAMLAARRPSRR